MVRKEISYMLGFSEIFDHILMYVAGMENGNRITVKINASNNQISIRGDGNGIPFVKKNGKWNASVDFGEKFKLSNIYSRDFLILWINCV